MAGDYGVRAGQGVAGLGIGIGEDLDAGRLSVTAAEGDLGGRGLEAGLTIFR